MAEPRALLDRIEAWGSSVDDPVNSVKQLAVADMTDIYQASLQAKYESVMRVVSLDLGLGDDLTALSDSSLIRVHNAADQAILDWASRRGNSHVPLHPITNLQHLLNEYCAIAEHL